VESPVNDLIEESVRSKIDELVAKFIKDRRSLSTYEEMLLTSFRGSETLTNITHSIKSRLKDPEHLKDKLFRKARDLAKEHKPFDINEDNLYKKINDSVGIRIMHIHSRQFEDIHRELLAIFEEHNYPLLEPPTARSWDDETRGYFRGLGINVIENPPDKLNFYTSVHYIVQANQRSAFTGEIQVRTLMEEIWGEVDHAINYPHRTAILSSREQLKVLARVTSSCSRLVDSIFLTHKELTSLKKD